MKKDTTFKHIKLSAISQVDVTSLKPNKFNSFFKIENADYFKKLKDDVEQRGIIVALVAKEDGTLLAGHNRLLVAKILKMKTVPVQYVTQKLSADDERKFVVADNVIRRQLSHAERMSLYRTVYPDFDAVYLQELNPSSAVSDHKLKGTQSIMSMSQDLNISDRCLRRDINLAKAQKAQKNKKAMDEANSINTAFIDSTKSILTRILAKTYTESEATKEAMQQLFTAYNAYMSHIDDFTIRQVSSFSSDSANTVKQRILGKVAQAS